MPLPNARSASIAGIVLALCCLTAALGAPAALAATIEGTVSAPGAVEEVEVCVLEGEPSETCAYPAANGHYSLLLAPGAYVVEFLPSYRSHYLRQYFNDKSSPAQANKVTVGELSPVSGIDAVLEKGGQIEGRVTDAATSLPLAEVEACAQEAIGAAVVGCSHTDANGEYTIPGLAPGSYEVGFWGEGESAGYLPQYYEETTFATADPVAVTAGTPTPGIDARLHEGAGIQGTVSDAASGADLPGIAVCVLKVGAPGPERCTRTDGGGKYAIPGLASGSYTLVFSPEFSEFAAAGLLSPEADGYLTQYYDEEPNLAAANQVSLLAPGAVSIDAGLSPAADVPATPPQAALAPAASHAGALSIAPVPMKCGRGLARRKVGGKVRCVRRRHRRRHRAAKARVQRR